jgi:hypothetical protein
LFYISYIISRLCQTISRFNPFLNNYDDRRQIFTLLSVTYNSAKVSASSTYRQIDLSTNELANGCKLGLDTWADTCCIGKHAHVDSYVEGKTVTASGFASNLPSLENIPIVNCSFAYDDEKGRTFLLQINNALYMGENMEHS